MAVEAPCTSSDHLLVDCKHPPRLGDRSDGLENLGTFQIADVAPGFDRTCVPALGTCVDY